jgi:PLP dependent protein
MDAALLKSNLELVEARIGAALERAGRRDPVRIVAITKTHGPEAVAAAAAVGLTDCGENRVRELVAKRLAAGDIVTWHFVGHLQRNKVREALPHFDLIQSVDSLRLAGALSQEAERSARQVRLLIQVNASGEASKGGFTAAEAVEAAGRVSELPGLRVQGLMSMAPLTDDVAVLRSTFAATRDAFERCTVAVPAFEPCHLSMGMSNDFEVAIEEGSTMVRLGTILFGERNP